MKYNILVVRNKNLKVNIQDDLIEAQEFFNEYSPIKIEWEYLDVDVKTAFKFFKKNSRGQQAYGLKGVKDQLRPLIEKNTYHCVIFAYNVERERMHKLLKATKKGYIASWSRHGGLFPGTEYIELATGGFTDFQGTNTHIISHELVHSFVKRANRAGRNVNDFMDRTPTPSGWKPYYKNLNREASDGNYALTLAELHPHWDAVVAWDKVVQVDVQKDWPYINFKKSEFRRPDKVNPKVIQGAQYMRTSIGISVSVNNDHRTKAENDAIKGAAKNSAHLTGDGLDLGYEGTGGFFYRIAKFIYTTEKSRTMEFCDLFAQKLKETDNQAKAYASYREFGIRRIGLYAGHDHIDVSTTLPQDVVWVK